MVRGRGTMRHFLKAMAWEEQLEPRSRQRASYLPHEDDFECLPPEATGEERRKKCDLMEAKKRRVQDAIDNPEKLPESIGLARKRIKWLDKQIAQEMRKWWRCMKKDDKKWSTLG